MSDFVVALGLVLVIEGCAYALFPGGIKRIARRMGEVSDQTLRTGGLALLVAGVAVVWLARG